MKRKIAMLLVSATLAIALLGGGVYAYFSDSENSDNNNFTAGTMDLTLNDGGAAAISLSNVAPGDSGLSMYTLRNIGTIDGNLQVSIANLENLPGSNPEPEGPGDIGNLAQSIHVHFWMDDGDGSQEAGEIELYDGVLSGVTMPSSSSLLAAGGSTFLALAWDIPTTIGNEIQGDIVNFDLVFTLQQVP